MFHFMKIKTLFGRLAAVFLPVLELQISLVFGFAVSFLVSCFYLYVNDLRYPHEEPWILGLGFVLSLFAFLSGRFLGKYVEVEEQTSLAQGAWIVTLTWILACFISSIVFFLAGFPSPDSIADLSLMRRFMDSFFESMSGFTTTGGSILPDVEVFSRSILFWRELTHWIGGMGIVYMAVTLWKHFSLRRADLINGEAETHVYVNYRNEEEAVQSGWDFLKTYGLMSFTMVVLLFFSGIFFRETPYLHWYDNLYDTIVTMLGTMGTGGFMVYNASVGLPVLDEFGQVVAGGLQNPVSEWIIAFFMMFAGVNFSLWYVFIFKRHLKFVLKNREFQAYVLFIFVITGGIAFLLNTHGSGHGVGESLRFAFFTVTTIISTTGFANSDFGVWPVAAQALLFLCYLTGAMVGGTAGGLKFVRFLVFFKYSLIQIVKSISGRPKPVNFLMDGVHYDEEKAGLITLNILAYYVFFLFGGVLVLLTSSKLVFIDGTLADLDFLSGFSAAIASLGNIGPTILAGSANSGAVGNFSAYSDLAKFIMVVLMFVGRVGVLTFLMLFVGGKGFQRVRETRPTVDFDADEPLFLK
jgi:trk system potassium uptake protein TrkH